MSPTITIGLSANAARLIDGLQQLPATLLPAVAQTLDRVNEETVGYIQRTKLSQRGATTLGVRTNRLRSSARPERATISGRSVLSSIGSNVEYAGVHEFGFDGDVQVAGYTRRRFAIGRSKEGARTSVEDVSFSFSDGKIHRKVKKRVRYVTGEITVRPHKRHMRFPARRMFQTGIEERAGYYREQIGKTIEEVVTAL